MPGNEQAANMNSSYNSSISSNIKASDYNLGTLLSIEHQHTEAGLRMILVWLSVLSYYHFATQG